MIRYLALTVLLAITNVTPGLCQTTDDVRSIESLIETNYVRGVHIDRDHSLIRQGFHDSFTINVRINEDSLLVGTLDMWLSRLGTEANEAQISHKLVDMNITRNSATAKIEIYEDQKLIYTDYMLLYKFSKGWRFVSKIFEG